MDHKRRFKRPKLPHVDPHRTLVRTATAGHLTYYGMVFWEAHSYYGYSAGAMFIITCIGLLLHEQQEV